MSRTIAQLKTKITGRLHGTTLNKIGGDFYGICEDAAEVMLGRIDPVETARRTPLTTPVYDDVTQYALPADFKAPKNLNFQANEMSVNNSSLYRTYEREFTNRRKNNSFVINWRENVQFLQFLRNIHPPVTLDQCQSLTENGSWAVGGNASSLALDTIQYVAGTASIRAAVSNGGAFVNLKLRIGSDSGNYVEITVTTGHFDSIAALWNLVRFDLANATGAGTVDWTDITYLRLTMTYNTAQTAYFEKTLSEGVDLSDNYSTSGAVFLYFFVDSTTTPTVMRLDSVTANLGTYFDLSYYSNYLFRSSTGTWKSRPTADTDIINLSSASYKIFEAEVSKIVAQMVQGAMGVFDSAYWERELNGDGEDNTDRKEGLYDRYLAQYPSERIEGETQYYDTGLDQDGIYGGDSVDGQPISYYN